MYLIQLFDIASEKSSIQTIADVNTATYRDIKNKMIDFAFTEGKIFQDLHVVIDRYPRRIFTDREVRHYIQGTRGTPTFSAYMTVPQPEVLPQDVLCENCGRRISHD